MSLVAHLSTLTLVGQAASVRLRSDADIDEAAADTASAMAYAELAAMDPAERAKLNVQATAEEAAAKREQKVKSMPLKKDEQLSEDQAIAAFQLQTMAQNDIDTKD